MTARTPHRPSPNAARYVAGVAATAAAMLSIAGCVGALGAGSLLGGALLALALLVHGCTKEHCDDYEVCEGGEVHEAEHDAFGLEYVRRALSLLPEQARASWHEIAVRALRPQRERAEAVLRQIPREQRRLEAFDAEREVALGLFSPQRQALVFERTYAERLEPRLRELRLL